MMEMDDDDDDDDDDDQRGVPQGKGQFFGSYEYDPQMQSIHMVQLEVLVVVCLENLLMVLKPLALVAITCNCNQRQWFQNHQQVLQTDNHKYFQLHHMDRLHLWIVLV